MLRGRRLNEGEEEAKVNGTTNFVIIGNCEL